MTIFLTPFHQGHIFLGKQFAELDDELLEGLFDS